jgi:hypothetical protein
VAEWSKALAWKVSIRQNRIEGSNPSRSAASRSFFAKRDELRRNCILVAVGAIVTAAALLPGIDLQTGSIVGLIALAGCAARSSRAPPRASG